jgi:tRNA-Thr(GGU) m(6)t(6)A37 methyltransferase TsaA
MSEIIYKPIGFVHSPYKSLDNMPIQPSGAMGIKGQIEIESEFIDGLSDLAGFSHIIVLYHMHLVNTFRLKVIPFIDSVERGVFATRSPVRPNPIGLTVAKLISIEGKILNIEDFDMVDQTPVIDIKPYFPLLSDDQEIKIGWLTCKTGLFESVRSKESN